MDPPCQRHPGRRPRTGRPDRVRRSRRGGGLAAAQRRTAGRRRYVRTSRRIRGRIRIGVPRAAAAWRRGDEIFAEVWLTDPAGPDRRFGLHPVLLDAAVQVLGLEGAEGLDTGAGPIPEGSSVMPFSWTDVDLWASGVTRLRVRVGASAQSGTSAQSGVSVHAADENGQPVAAVGALVLRPVSVDRGAGADAALIRDTLFSLEWQQVIAPSAGELQGLTPAVFHAGAKSGEEADDLPGVVHSATAEALHAVQDWLRRDDIEDDARLIVLTRGAVSTEAAEPVTDLAGAAVWGLIRSVQSEHPGRFVLVDLPQGAEEGDVEPSVWAAAARGDEPQLAVRSGSLLVPRLVRAAVGSGADPGVGPDAATPVDWSEGTVVVTGATGGLGTALVRHLVDSGARDLLLLSRSGMSAPGAGALMREAATAGARVRLVACDVSQCAELSQVLKQLKADGREPAAVVHLAGTTADATVEGLTADRLDQVLAAKADAAWYLHELTAELAPAARLVLFSSAAGTLGSPGMANYAAANAFLDALAAVRHAAGLLVNDLAWGAWAEAGGMGGRLGDADQRRMARVGEALATDEALRLFDLALAENHSVLIPTRLRTARLRGVDPASIPAVLRALVPASGRGSGAGVAPAPTWTERLAGLGADELPEVLLTLVRELIARVLGHGSAEEVPADRTFTELGFDSLTAVEARNALSAATGLRLPATLVFDHPDPQILVGHLSTLLGPSIAEAGSGAVGAAARPSIAADTSDEAANPIARMYIEACEADKYDEAWGFARAVARLAPKFSGPEDIDRVPEPLVLAEGPEADAVAADDEAAASDNAEAVVFCFPSFSPASGPHEYTRFAAGLRGRRRVLLVRQPGFLDGERLPESFDALVRLHADTVLRTAGEALFVLVGRSASGWLAYSLARHLEERGRAPLAAVLIDTYFGEAQERENLFHGARAMMEREKRSTMLSDVRVTAMGCYEGLIEHWRPEPITAPTLLVRATTPFSTQMVRPDGLDWRASMTFAHDTRDVPGDHFTMLEEYAEDTAEAVQEWLGEVPLSAHRACEQPLSAPGAGLVFLLASAA
ncbi:type I polyketide synthase [Catenulispora yoronensis]